MVAFVFFRLVHSVCLWDEKGAASVNNSLKEEIINFIKNTQTVSVLCKFLVTKFGSMHFHCTLYNTIFSTLNDLLLRLNFGLDLYCRKYAIIRMNQRFCVHILPSGASFLRSVTTCQSHLISWK
jgi:hypothetical protein